MTFDRQAQLERIADREWCWRHFEAALLYNEVYRLIQRGWLKPEVYAEPTMLVKNPNIPARHHIFGDGVDWSIKMEVINGE